MLVGHNVAFDMRFLKLKEDASGVVFHQPVLDTLLLSSVVHPNEASHSLEAIAARLGVTASPAATPHSAMRWRPRRCSSSCFRSSASAAS